MPKKIVSDEVKIFIVKSLAVYESITETAHSIKEKFNLTLKPQTIQHYDPTKVAGEDLSEDLKALFFATRKQFDEQEALPFSKKHVRVKKLSKYVEFLELNDNLIGAAAILEQIAKEEGGAFTNRREIDLKDVSKLTDEELQLIANSKG